MFKIKQKGERKTIYIFNKKLFSYQDKRVSAIDYARSLGVTLGNNVRFITTHKFPYSYPFFGSEPEMIEIGENTLISFNCTFITHDGSVSTLKNFVEINDKNINMAFGKIKIGKNCFIGCNVTILPGVTIGDNSIIGAGSVVTKDVPSGEVWAGNPAKYIKTTRELANKYEKS